MSTHLSEIAFIISLLFQTVKGQNCPKVRNGSSLPELWSYRNGDEITRHHQMIIPSYRFICNQMCGSITEWGVNIRSGGGMHHLLYALHLQVWRPSPTTNVSTGAGCYSLVGNNRFSIRNVQLRSYDLLKITPAPTIRMQFQPGDVLGFYVEAAYEANDGLVMLPNDSFPNQLVWYASIAPAMAASQNGDCPYSVGSSGVLNTLTQAAPAISISTVTFSCPSMVTTTQPFPPTSSTGSSSTGCMVTEARINTCTSNTTITESNNSQSPPIGLKIGLALCVIAIVMIVIATVTIVISVAVCCRVRRTPNTLFYMQRNRSYAAANHRDTVSSDNSTSLYIYPVVNIHQNDTRDNGGEYESIMTCICSDVTNTQATQSVEMDYLDIISDRIYETCNSVKMPNQEQSETSMSPSNC